MQHTEKTFAAITAFAAAGAFAVGCSNSTTSGDETILTAAPAPTPGAGEPGTDRSTIATRNGEFVVQGMILQKYNEAGGSRSVLGLPTSNEEAGPNGGRYSTFDGGAIYWTPETGAHIVWGLIRDAWEGDGGAGGALGYPTSDEEVIPGGWRSEFQHGAITYTDGEAEITR